MTSLWRTHPEGLAAAVGLLSLAGSFAMTGSLHGAAVRAIDKLLTAKLESAGESARLLFERVRPDNATLSALAHVNELDAAYVLESPARVSLDARRSAPHAVDLLRIDLPRVEAAFAGRSSVGHAFDVSSLEVISGYFPFHPASTSSVSEVLVLEAGESYRVASQRVDRAQLLGLGLSAVTAVALGLIALRFGREQRRAKLLAEEAARAQAIAEMAAMAAHEIRNPLGVIRGTVELMSARSGARLDPKDQSALGDVLEETARLRQLTEDFLDLSSSRPLDRSSVDLAEVLEESARSLEAATPTIRIVRSIERPLLLSADKKRLRQVFQNLLQNAVEAQREGEIELQAGTRDGEATIRVRDRGPGVPAEVRPRLFDPFFTTRSSGTGLGLAIARRHTERHGGSIALLDGPSPGATFEVRLPLEPGANDANPDRG
jgi:signal transduction histidine kinase